MTEKTATQSANLEQVLRKLVHILNSNTIYASALALNIEAFHKAVLLERELTELREAPGPDRTAKAIMREQFEMFQDVHPGGEKQKSTKRFQLLKFKAANQ